MADRIEPLQLEVSNLLKKSVELEKANVDLKVRYDDLQKEAEKYRVLLREEKRSKVSLEEKRKGAEEELDRLSKKYESRISGKETQEVDVEEERKKQREEVIELKAQVRTYKLEVTDLVDDKRKLQDELEEAERKLREKERALERATSNVQDLEVKLHNKEEKLLKNKEEDEKALIQQMEKDATELKKKLESKRQKNRDLKESKAKLDREAKENTRKLSSFEKQIENLEEEAKVAQDKIEELGKKVREGVDQVLGLKHDKQELAEENEKVKAREKEYKVKIEDAKRDEERLRNEMKELRKRYGEKDRESRTLNDLKSEIAQQLEQMKSEKFEAEDLDDEGLVKTLEETRKKYEAEKVKSNSLQGEIDRLTIELEDTRKFSDEIESLKAKVLEKKQEKKEVKSELKDAKKDLDKITRERDEAEEDKNLLILDLEGAKQKLKTALSGGNSPKSQEGDATETEERVKKLKEAKKQLEEEVEKLKQNNVSEQSIKNNNDRRIVELQELLEKERENKQKELDEHKKKYDEESKGALARKERMEDEITTLKSRIKELQTREAAQEAEKNKLQDELYTQKRRGSNGSNNGKAVELTDREKVLKAQFEKLKQLVAESEKQHQKTKDQAADVVENVKDKLDVGRDQLAALKRATTRLQAQIDVRRERLTNAGVNELGLIEVLEEEEDRLTAADIDIIKTIKDRDQTTLDRTDALVNNLHEKLGKAKHKNKARVLIEVKVLVRDIATRLSDKVSHKQVEKELAQSASIIAACKKLQARIVHEMHLLQEVAQDIEEDSGAKDYRYGWWKRKGSRSANRIEDVEAAVAFLQTESQRLADLRDKYILTHNKVAVACESIHRAEKDLVRWKLGLEELQDRVTVGAGWGHAALTTRLLACRRLLDRHFSLRIRLNAAAARRTTLHLSVDTFTEGLHSLFSEGIEGMGVRGIAELTRIRDLETQVLHVREEMDESHFNWEKTQAKHKSELVQGHAGTLLVEAFISNFDEIFDTYDDEDVPELVVKSVDYLLDNGLEDKSLLIRDYDLPKINQIKEYFDAGTYDVDLSDCTDHRVVSELLKSYLRDAHDCLLTANLYEDWIMVDEIVDGKKRLEAIQSLLDRLPETNYATLAVVIELLVEINKNAKVNHCNKRLLAKTFGPLLLRPHADR